MPKGNSRTHKIPVLVTPEEFGVLAEEAKIRGLPVSTYLRAEGLATANVRQRAELREDAREWANNVGGDKR